MPIWLSLALVAMVCWGASGVTQKLAASHLCAKLSLSVFAAVMMPVGVTLVPFFSVDLHLEFGVIVLGVLGGVAFTLGQYGVFVAFERGGKASTVVPIVSMFP